MGEENASQKNGVGYLAQVYHLLVVVSRLHSQSSPPLTPVPTVMVLEGVR